MLEHVGPLVRVFEQVGVHIGQHRLLAQVVADEVGDLRVQRLVVGYPVAHGVGQGDVAGPGGVEDPGATEQRTRLELERVQELVVHAPVYDVHPLLARSRAHVDDPVATYEVTPFDQGHAHLAGQEGMFEIGRIVDPRGKDHHRRALVGVARRGRPQSGQEVSGVVGDGPDLVAGKELGEDMSHGPAVLDHVGDAGGGP